jgi:hypothetical protein
LIAFVVAAMVAGGGLLGAAATDHRDTAFALDVANNRPVASLRHGRTLCQGPITVKTVFSALELWARPARALDVQVRTAHGRRLLAARRVTTWPSLTGEITVQFGARRVRRGERIEVCVGNAGPRRIAFAGGPPNRNSGTIHISRRRLPMAIALLFLEAHSPTLLGLLHTVFDRASLFKFSWIGAWTFWVLGAALLLAFPLAGAAVVWGAEAEPDDERG